MTQVLNRYLAELLSRSEASEAYIIDESGALITREGRMRAGNPAELASLIACNFLVTDELAKYLGDEKIKVLFHEGENKNIYMKRVSERSVLVILFEDLGALAKIKGIVEYTAKQLYSFLTKIECDRIPGDALPKKPERILSFFNEKNFEPDKKN
jgi:predicted regulator of Ras-like GTPase activity (Roadblock/LC7/MglB family)